MYFIFDCTKSEGYAFTTPYKWFALLGSRFLSKATGRVHDFENMSTAFTDPHH